jgi:UPF0716 protein FxsA
MLLVALFLVLPFAELAVIVASADAIGLGWTLLLLLALSVSGAVMVRREGASVWRRLNAELAAGALPTTSVVDGTMVLAGGALLLTPGFLTDVVGLLLILPPTRAALRPLLLRRLASRTARSARAGGFAFVRTSVVDASSAPADATAGRTRPAVARIIDLTIEDPPGRDESR